MDSANSIRISKKIVGQIIALSEDGLNKAQIARKLDVSRSTVANYLNPDYLKKNKEFAAEAREQRLTKKFNGVMKLMRVTQ